MTYSGWANGERAQRAQRARVAHGRGVTWPLTAFSPINGEWLGLSLGPINAWSLTKRQHLHIMSLCNPNAVLGWSGIKGSVDISRSLDA